MSRPTCHAVSTTLKGAPLLVIMQSWKVKAKGRFSNELAFFRLDFMELV
jgi:hypothetical protein